MARQKLVLVIEDEDYLRQEMVRYLQRHGYEVASCETARASRDQLAAWSAAGTAPFAVLCDESLPDGDGTEIFLDLAASFPGSRWILVSGFHDEGGRLFAAERKGPLPAHQVLEKPFNLNSLKLYLA